MRLSGAFELMTLNCLKQRYKQISFLDNFELRPKIYTLSVFGKRNSLPL